MAARLGNSSSVLLSHYHQPVKKADCEKFWQLSHLPRYKSANPSRKYDRAEVRARAEQILQLSKQGKNFGELAKQYSEGSQRQSGGDYGWRERSFFRKELGEIAFALKANEVSNVIETPEAFYLMQVEEIRFARVRPVGEVRNEIEKILLGKERTRLQQKYVDRLKKKSFVRYFEM